ncbi:MAG: tyrosinase family protein [Alphaproteobacteria bacterium]|nr:tyrosinase family protein [Alphaproteobacteria bacterium]
MADKQVSNPTYMANIRHFFTDGDKGCMAGRGIDLGTYEGVKFNALRIYFKVRDGEMPVGAPRWKKARVETFYNWMKNDYPRGIAAPKRPKAARRTDAQFKRRPARREDAATYSGRKLAKLKTAFQALMDKPATDPDSYFALAGLHWLPKPTVYCRHHENAYNPWQRAYMNHFEDALRRVPGCADVTLPYWDITSRRIPAFLFKPPFDSYKFPQDLYDFQGERVAKKGDRTKRNGARHILASLACRNVTETVETALTSSRWELFNGWVSGNTHGGIISAHDNGHNACGETMQNQDIAAFDPIFWFFHSNWDRVWWNWQRNFDAMTVDSFKSHLIGTPDWLSDPVLNGLPPFDVAVPDTINLANFDVSYGPPKAKSKATVRQTLKAGSVAAYRPFHIGTPNKVSVRAKNVDRLKIPGSFDVVLQVRGREIARTGLFQSTMPSQCSTCRMKALANFDFEVDLAALNGPVSLKILLHQKGKEMNFPLTSCGSPSINARLLLT